MQKWIFVAVTLAVGAFQASAFVVPGAAKNVTVEEIEPLADLDYQWLYELIIPEKVRSEFPERSFKSFRVHLKDSYKNFLNPQAIHQSELKPAGFQTGKITYVGIFPKAYKYNVLRSSSGESIFQVKIYLKNPKQGDLEHFQMRIKEAQDIWNQSRVPMDFDYRFEFMIVTNAKEAQFTVNVKDTTRGPYDTNWGRSWTGRTIAHEMGHALGLGDEYKTLSGESDCYEASLMCSSSHGELMAHHYYFVLRRLVYPLD